jgi:hypothetical protein
MKLGLFDERARNQELLKDQPSSLPDRRPFLAPGVQMCDDLGDRPAGVRRAGSELDSTTVSYLSTNPVPPSETRRRGSERHERCAYASA